VSDAKSAYAFVQASYINGTQSTLAQLFSWMGGFMPPGGPASNATASQEVEAWIAAGAKDN
jgi:hypothetical protein